MKAVIVILALVTLVSVHCDDDTEITTPSATCELSGVEYAIGELVASDSCNTCKCDGEYGIMCTIMACPEHFDMCFVENQWYENGDEIPSGDSCNTCTCDSNEVVCTQMACNESDVETTE